MNEPEQFIPESLQPLRPQPQRPDAIRRVVWLGAGLVACALLLYAVVAWRQASAHERAGAEQSRRLDATIETPETRAATSNRIARAVQAKLEEHAERMDEIRRRQAAGESWRSIQDDLRHRDLMEGQQRILDEVKRRGTR